MRKNRWLWMVLFVFVLLSSSSCIRHWQVIRKPMPRPFPADASFVLLPPSFKGVIINNLTLPDYMSRKNPVDRGKWRTIMSQMRNLFAQELRNNAQNVRVRLGSRPRPGEYVIDPAIYSVQTGFYAGIVNRPSLVQMRVAIRKGQTTYDEFVVRSSTAPNAGGGVLPAYPTVASRMRRDGAILGRNAGWYMRERMKETVEK